MPLLHEDAHDVHRTLGHAVGELLDRNRLRDCHLTGNFFLGLGVTMAGLAQHPAAECGLGALTLLTRRKCGDDGQPSAPLFAAAARWLRRRGRPRGGAASGSARRLILVGFERWTRAGFCRQNIGAKPLFGDFVGLTPGFFIVFAALFFVALAGLGGGALYTLVFFTRAARAGLFFGPLPLF